FVFDYREGDVFGCMADIGWITGHSYVVYGPLCNGATTVLFESTPLYPDPGESDPVKPSPKYSLLYLISFTSSAPASQAAASQKNIFLFLPRCSTEPPCLCPISGS
ncbi:hypothetical protein XENOCAPTIV_027885, partial [Xenoophorus captivus]